MAKPPGGDSGPQAEILFLSFVGLFPIVNGYVSSGGGRDTLSHCVRSRDSVCSDVLDLQRKVAPKHRAVFHLASYHLYQVYVLTGGAGNQSQSL
jgi:hypothetical protein